MDNQTVKKINPVVETAQLTLRLLGQSGCREAADLLQKFGFEQMAEKYDLHDASERVNILIHESRYEFLNRQIRKAGSRNVLDIACGFSPRGLKLAREGFNYVGLDLDLAVNSLSPIAAQCSREEALPGSFCYRVVDVTDPQAIAAAAAGMRGPVTIVCEGLFMYLQKHEADKLLEGIKAVLGAHGGCFLTPDFSMSKIFIGAYTSQLGPIKGMSALLRQHRSLEQNADTKVDDSLVERTNKHAREFFAARGFTIEEVPYFESGDRLCSFDLLDPKKQAALTRSFSDIRCWRVTAPLCAESAAPAAPADKGEKLTVTVSRQNNTLTIALRGRMDTTTADIVLRQYEAAKADGAFSEVVFDLAELVYISSAGLRILTMIAKEVGPDSTRLINASDAVWDIFVTTGFKQALHIHHV